MGVVYLTRPDIATYHPSLSPSDYSLTSLPRFQKRVSVVPSQLRQGYPYLNFLDPKLLLELSVSNSEFRIPTSQFPISEKVEHAFSILSRSWRRGR